MSISKLLFLIILCGLNSSKNINSTAITNGEQSTDCVELEQKYLTIQVENSEYRLEIARLRKSYFDLRHDESNCLSSIKQNFSIVAQDVENINYSLNSLWQQIRPFKTLVNKIEERKNTDIKAKFTDSSDKLPKSCAAIVPQKSGIYEIDLSIKCLDPFKVACNADFDGGNWTIIQRRIDGNISFYRNWRDYKEGFGNLDGEFFIGLEKLHHITKYEPQELIFLLTDFDDMTVEAKYNQFEIGSADELYAVTTLGSFDGGAGDSFKTSRGMRFSTFDQDNDGSSGNCAESHKGAWWYDGCGDSNLNGLNLFGSYYADTYYKGIFWDTFHGVSYSLKSTLMMIRPKLPQISVTNDYEFPYPD